MNGCMNLMEVNLCLRWLYFPDHHLRVLWCRLDSPIVRTFILEEITCANLLFEGYENLPPRGFQIEEGQVEKKSGAQRW